MPKTIRVRIAVAVNECGDWEAYGAEIEGAGGDGDEGKRRRVSDEMPTDDDGGRMGMTVHFIEHDLPLPEPQLETD
jgi:hypothetical protein